MPDHIQICVKKQEWERASKTRSHHQILWSRLDTNTSTTALLLPKCMWRGRRDCCSSCLSASKCNWLHHESVQEELVLIHLHHTVRKQISARVQGLPDSLLALFLQPWTPIQCHHHTRKLFLYVVLVLSELPMKINCDETNLWPKNIL